MFVVLVSQKILLIYKDICYKSLFAHRILCFQKGRQALPHYKLFITFWHNIHFWQVQYL